MTRKSATLSLLFSLAIVLFIGYLLMKPTNTDGLARVHMLNVGQGDSFLIQAANGRQLLIDGGRDTSVLTELAKVMPRGDRSIDVVLATHPDADHIGGLSFVLDRYDVDLFLTSKVAADTELLKTIIETIQKKDIPAYYAREGMNLSFDQVLSTDFSILFPDRDTDRWETNTASVVGRLQIGKRSVLFMGDAPESIEAHLIKNNTEAVDVDVLKLGHHGSKTSSSEAFLRTASPTLALISAGVENSYGHPSTQVIERLKKLAVPFVSTQERGTYSLKTDGQQWVEIK